MNFNGEIGSAKLNWAMPLLTLQYDLASPVTIMYTRLHACSVQISAVKMNNVFLQGVVCPVHVKLKPFKCKNEIKRPVSEYTVGGNSRYQMQQ